MQLNNECFLKVKKDYLNFLNKEKIFNKSKVTKLKNLKKIYIPISLWIEEKYKKPALGLFGADMSVSLVNEGPITFWFES